MYQIKVFCFNPFQENTILIYNEEKQCIVFDPGCSDTNEQNQIRSFLENHELKMSRLINTHCHIDHILGNAFIESEYGILPEYHQLEQPVLDSGRMVADMYHIPYDPSSSATRFLNEGDVIEFGDTQFEIILCPGHSPGSLVFYDGHKNLIAGDVLFRQSIGRTDLPGGNHEALLASISQKLYLLPDDVTVFPGHGPTTTIGYEKKNNPFVKG